MGEDERCTGVEPNSEAVAQGAGQGTEAVLHLAASGNTHGS